MMEFIEENKKILKWFFYIGTLIVLFLTFGELIDHGITWSLRREYLEEYPFQKFVWGYVLLSLWPFFYISKICLYVFKNVFRNIYFLILFPIFGLPFVIAACGITSFLCGYLLCYVIFLSFVNLNYLWVHFIFIILYSEILAYIVNRIEKSERENSDDYETEEV